jgi:hypothetical protein
VCRVAHDRYQCRAFVNTVMNLSVPFRQEVSLNESLPTRTLLRGVSYVMKTGHLKVGIEYSPETLYRTPLSTLLFADDHIIIQANEDQLQRALHKLNVISKMYNLKISTQQTKIMNGIQRKVSSQK